jgi:hypothetical protein
MRAAVLALALALAACGGDAGETCPILFGNPTTATGLGADRCRPACACGDAPFVPPTYDAAFIQALVDDWRLDPPFAALASDPYAQPAPPADPAGTVCAVTAIDPSSMHPRRYALASFASVDAAVAAGAHPTHHGACGVCSTLANLAVYMRQNDLGALVRQCGIDHMDQDGDVACLEALGFDHPCAQIWAYNTAHTRSVCLATCIKNFDAPYNLDDGSLNPCLQCDEDLSGPVFKAIAGRTRRNSGLPNAICRPCGEVLPLVHAY